VKPSVEQAFSLPCRLSSRHARPISGTLAPQFSRSVLFAFRLSLCLGVPVVNLFSQQPQTPHIGYLYPAGAQQGTTVEVTLGGQFLNGAETVYVSGKGVKATMVKNLRPMPGREIQNLREEVQQLAEKRQSGKATPEEISHLFTLREKLTEVTRPPSSPAIAEQAILQFVVAPDAEPGPRAVRVDTAAGLTNPTSFYVDRYHEFTRPSQKVPIPFVVVNGATPPQRPARENDKPIEITLPAIVNGQVMPAITDRYRFQAAKGQHLVVAAAARELVPYISDAVPGWFQAVVTLRDASGKELATADHFRFHPDPVLYYEIPAAGTYTLEVHDSIYRGREDFVYRVTIGEIPYITDVFPLGGKLGAKLKLETRGYNLPPRPLNLKVGQTPVPHAFQLDKVGQALSPANSASRRPQKVKLPITLDGRISTPGEVHTFRIDARAGEELEAEVFARRLDSPLDSFLRLTDAQGHQLAFNDDVDDKAAGLLTHYADSRLIYKFAAKGAYLLQLSDTERKGGPEYAYRLKLGHPDPDFELRVVPASLNIRAGTTQPISVYAVRRGGFNGPIDLKLKDVPAGWTLGGAIIPPGQDQVRLTITAPAGKVDVPMAVQLEGRSGDLHHNALPAEDMMQAFYYHHLVIQPDWMVRVIGAGGPAVAWKPVEKPVRISAGATGQLSLPLPPRFAGQVTFTLDDPPDDLTIEKVVREANAVTVIFKAGAKLKPGAKGNLILDAFIQRQNQNRRQPLGAIPAIPFEVVAP
jgi:hypothetical protein